jgi:homocitrate synthase
MTDAEFKQCTMKIKELADIRPIAIDDADSIIRAFHRGLKSGQPVDLLPNMTSEEKELWAQKEKELNGLPEKRQLDDSAETSQAKKVESGIAA